jgi:membrane dipeptidase
MAGMSFHDDCLVLDAHVDAPMRLWESPADLSLPQPDRHLDLPRLLRGGVDALVFALYLPPALSAERGLEHAETLYRLTVEALGVPGFAAVAGERDLRAAVERREVAVLLGLENGRPLCLPGALERVDEMGVRYVTLTHGATHEWCDSSTDAPAHSGLSLEGIEIVRRMARLGIVADLSHVSDDAVLAALAVSPIPVVASHSSARALCDHPRNLPDSLVREIARKRGVVMANSYPAFVGREACRADRERMRELAPALAAVDAEHIDDPALVSRERMRLFAEHPLPPVPFAVFVDHVLHLVDVGGEEHVGIGTDFDGIPETLDGFEDVARFPELTAALLARGVDRAGVRLILGENFLRVLRAAEKYADSF